MDATVGELAAVEGVGQVIASAVVGWCADPAHRDLIERLRAAGVNLEGPEVVDVPQTLPGKTVVVTGTLERYNREEVEAALKLRGGKSPGSVSNKTPAGAVGAGPGAPQLTQAPRPGGPGNAPDPPQ